MEKPSKLTTKKLIIILASIFVVCGIALGALVLARNANKVASTESYGYVNPDETKAEPDEGFTIDGVLDEAQYQKNNWLYLHNNEGGADVDIAMTSYYGEKGMYFVYDVTERTPIYVNLDRASYLNSCIEMYFAPSSVTALNKNSVFEVDLMPTGDMTFKKSNGKGGYVNVATTDDTMAVLGATTKGGEVNTEECTGYNLELFIPWTYLDKLGMDVDAMKESYTYVNPAHITSFNYAGTDTGVDRYWYFFAQQHGATFSNVYQYFRFDQDGALGTMPTKKTEGEHVSITGDAAVIPGMKTTYKITPEKGYAINSVLVNGEEYISKVSYDKEGAVLLTIRGKVEGLDITATAEAVTDGNKTLSGTISISKVGGDTLAGVSASYNGPTGEKPIEFDAAGNFTLTDLKQGYYTITVEKEGYDKLTRGIYLNRDITTELVLEAPVFEVVSGGCWMLDFQNEGILNKFGGAGVILSKDSYSKFTVEANFRFDEELTKEYEDNTHFTQQRQGFRIKFSNEKVWHIDVIKDDGKYFVQYAKFSGDNTMFGWKTVREMNAAEIAKFTGEDGIKLEVQRDGKYANVYLDDKLIAIEVLDDEFAKCTAQIGFESWDAKRTIYEIPYKITNKTDVNLASGIFKMAKEWDLTNQYKGLLKIPNCDGDAGWIGFLKNYQNIDLTLNIKDYVGNKSEFRHVVKFTFDNDESVALSIACADDQYIIQSMGDTLYGWRTHYKLTDAQIAKLQSGAGIDFRIVRIGTEMTAYLDGEQVVICDLTKNKKNQATGITADMAAKVDMRHYGNEGHTVEIPFSVKETFNNVTITSVEGAHGKLVTPKQNYIIGDTVKLSGQGKEGYYCIGMKVNGAEVPMNWDGTYTFKATENAYTVEGTFAKRVFKDSKEWNLLKQNEGVISVPIDHDGDSGWVDFYKQYKDIDLTLTSRDYIGNNAELRHVVKFTFDNGETAAISIVCADNQYIIQSMGDTLYGWGTHHKMTDEQIAKWQSEEGIDFRIVREGTEILVFLDDALVKVCDLTSTNKKADTGITADMAATVSIRQYGNDGYASELPFEVSDTVDDTISGILELPNGGNVNNIIRHHATDLDLTLLVKDIDETKDGGTENTAARNDVLFDFENGENVSFSVVRNGDDCIVQSMKLGDGSIYSTWFSHYELTDEEVQKYMGDGLKFRIVRIGTEISLYIEDKFVGVCDAAYFHDKSGNVTEESGVTADTKAKVTVRHYDDAGVKIDIPVEWTDKIDLVSIKCVENDGSKVATNKKNYFVGDTVILSDGAKDGYYCAGMKVNGEDVAMNWDGTYTFKATEKEYTVEGTFDKAVFKANSEWNLLKQNVGIVAIQNCDANVSWLDSVSDEYGNVDVRFTLKDYKPEDKNFRMGAKLTFTNEEDVAFSITNDGFDTYVLQNMAGSMHNWGGADYTLSDTQIASITGEGLEFRIVRVGAIVDVYIGGTHAYEYVLTPSNAENAVDKLTTKISLRYYGNSGCDVEIPFSIADAPTPIEINIADTENGTISTKDKNYFVGETVVVTAVGDSGYAYKSLKVDGTEVDLDWDETYRFEATKASYTVEGSFSKAIFKANSIWNLTKQNKNVLLIPETPRNNAETGDTGWLYSVGKTYEDIDLKLALRDVTGAKGFRAAVRLQFTNNEYVTFTVTNDRVGDGSTYELQNMGGTILDWTVPGYTLKPEQVTAIRSAEGLEFRVVRVGDTVDIYLGGTHAWEADISKLKDGVTASGVKDLKSDVQLRFYGNKECDVEVPFSINDAPTPIEIDIKDTENGTVVTKNKNYFANEEVTLTVTPKAGYECTSLKVADKEVTLDNGTYKFTATEMKYAVEAVFRQIATINIADTENGTISTTKTKYYVGDDVVLKVEGDSGYYYDSLKVNGKDIVIDWDGTYTFTAKETNTVTGSFSKGIWGSNASFNLINQNVGVLGTSYASNANSGWIYAGGNYNELSMTVKDYKGIENSGASGAEFSVVGRFTFANDKAIAVRIINENGTYKLTTFGSGYIYGFGTWSQNITDTTLIEKIQGEGVELKLVRSGTKFEVWFDGTKLTELDLTRGNSGVTDTMAVKNVGIRHYGNNGTNVELPYSVSLATAIINIDKDITNGTVTTDKDIDSYLVGDTVVLTVTPEEGYYQKLKVNGETVVLDWTNSTYTFTAKKTNSITGSFEKGIWGTNTAFNLSNQNVGVLGVSYASGANSGWIYTDGNYDELSMTVKDYKGIESSGASGAEFSVVGRFTFANDKAIAVRIINENGTYRLTTFGSGYIYGFGTWSQDITDTTLIEKIQGEGVELKLVRVDTKLEVWFDGTKLTELDLTRGNSGVTDTMAVKNVGIRLYGNDGYTIELPYSVSLATATVSIDDAIANGTVTTDKESYMLGDTVVLTVTPADGYYHNLQVNGETIVIDWEDNTYTFTAKKTNMVTGTFDKGMFDSNTAINKLNQNAGVLKVSYKDGANSGWTYVGGNYEELSMTVKDYKGLETSGNSGAEFSVVGKFTFSNDKWAAVRIINENKVYKLTTFGTSIFGWSDLSYSITDETLINKIQQEGVELKLVRVGTKLQVWFDGTQIKELDLTSRSSGVTDTMAVKNVGIRLYGNGGYDIELPFTIK